MDTTIVTTIITYLIGVLTTVLESLFWIGVGLLTQVFAAIFSITNIWALIGVIILLLSVVYMQVHYR